MFTKKYDDHKKATLLDTSVLAVFSGFAVASLFPAYGFIAAIMSACGIGGIINYAMSWSKFDRLWPALGLTVGTAQPYLKNKERTDHSIIYKFTLPAGLSSDDFEKHKLAIEQFCGRDIDIKYTYKELWIEVFNQTQKTLYEYETVNSKGAVAFPVGYNRQGKLITCDLSSGEPHMLIAGETGSGKSTVLRSIITNLILTKNIKLHLIDLKNGAEFSIFRKCSKVENFCRTRSEAKKVLEYLSEEIDRRYDLFFKNDCVDIKEYNRKISHMGYEVLVIDEFADLQAEKNSLLLLEELAAKARACGIHMIIATQRPDHQILNGRIKANVTTILGLKTMNEMNSRIIIDDVGLEKLRGKGHGILKRGSFVSELQCPYLTTERARELLKPTYVDKPVKAESHRQGEVKDFNFFEVM